MKLLTIIGARPQFIKASAISCCMKEDCGIDEIIVHTGQHYDEYMSDIFFSELRIPTPKYNLRIGSGSHGKQTAKMLEGIENVILAEKPDALVVYGDTNSTLAGALAACKLNVPVFHIEAGVRSFNKKMPEEINRILTDHISEFLFCPTETAVSNLNSEGIKRNVYNVGDIMYDLILKNHNFYKGRGVYDKCIEALEFYNEKGDLDIIQKGYYLATIHRADNADNYEKLEIILDSFNRLDAPVLFLVHPRTLKTINKKLCFKSYSNIIFAKPVSYLNIIILMNFARKILTDSGGIQKEAFFLKIPCVTLRKETEWPETMAGNWNTLAGINKMEILHKILDIKPEGICAANQFGDGKASERIVSIMKEGLKV